MKKRSTIPPVRPVFYTEQIVVWVDGTMKKAAKWMSVETNFRSVGDWLRYVIRKEHESFIKARQTGGK